VTLNTLDFANQGVLRDGHQRADPDGEDVQNIAIMDLAGFCRNCLSRWYQEAAEAKGLALDKEGAREIIYGMPYGEWKEKYQTEATPEQKAAFEKQHE
jgi:hypothetical protein